MAWLYLILAAILEVGWPLGFKLAGTCQDGKAAWLSFAVAAMALSGVFLFWAQKQIPIGTAYVVWTGCGAVGTVVIGICYFAEPATFVRFLGIALVIAGMLILKFNG